MKVPHLTFYTRRECHLCDAGRFVVERVRQRHGCTVEYLDIDEHPAVRPQYDHHVPVLLIDGVEHARHRIDEADLCAALQRRA